LHFIHHREAAVRSGADHEPNAFPGNLLLDRQRRVAVDVTELFGSFFLTFAYLSPVDYDVILVCFRIDVSEPNERFSNCMEPPAKDFYALFFDVMTEKVDQSGDLRCPRLVLDSRSKLFCIPPTGIRHRQPEPVGKNFNRDKAGIVRGFILARLFWLQSKGTGMISGVHGSWCLG
jgi:hypothetical protein